MLCNVKFKNNSQIGMSVVVKYETKQRQILVDFFKENLDKSFSVEDVYGGIKDRNISLSAVYRNVVELEKLGKLKKVIKDNTKKSFYQFIDCKECKNQLHLRCVKCGRCEHLASDLSHNIVAEIFSNTKFLIDKNETVLYGLCSKCK